MTGLSNTGYGGLVILIMVIVVTTMLTQAFSFAAIRVLEGYWGPGSLFNWLTFKMSSHHKDVQGKLLIESARLTKEIWLQVEGPASQARRTNGDLIFTTEMLSKLQERIDATFAGVHLTPDLARQVREYDWDKHVDPRLLQRHGAVEARLLDYPSNSNHVMATRLGNILRHHEDDTQQPDVEHFVERVYDALPFAMQLDHDEQRTRLDLYCSMVFVQVLAAVASCLAIGLNHWRYCLVIIGIALVGMLVAYLAAIASARYYGSILIRIANWVSHSP